MDPQPRSSIDRLIQEARRTYRRLVAEELPGAVRAGALLIDTRPAEQRDRDGDLPGAIVVDRNVLEWRLDPTSPHRIAEPLEDRLTVVVCNEGYSSTLAAVSLRSLGVDATDLVGGYQALRAGDLLRDLGEAAGPESAGVGTHV